MKPVRVLAEIESLDDMQDALHATLRARKEELGATFEALDHETLLAPGYVSKILSASRRNSGRLKKMGIESSTYLLKALATKVLLVEDPDEAARLRARYKKAREIAPSCSGPSIHPTTVPQGRSISSVLTEMGRAGAISLNESRTPERRSEIARNAAKARWAKRKPAEQDA